MGKILNKKIFYNVQRFIYAYLFLMITSSILYFLTEDIVRIIIYYILLICAGGKFLYREKTNKAVISSFFSYILLVMSEIIFAIILAIFYKSKNGFIDEYSLDIMANLGIFVVSMLLTSSKKVVQLLSKLLINLDNIAISKIIISSVIGIFLGFFILYCSYFELPTYYLLITDFLFVCCYVYTMYAYFNEINLRNCLKRNYDELLININEYERMYNTQKMISHEHKNQILTIKGLASKKNEKLLSYVNKILNDDIKDDNAWFNRLKAIPSGGIKGLLYYKILNMKEKNINVSFIMSKKISMKNLLDMPIDTNVNLCKILGVFLDNAMEAISEIEEKNITIEIYKEENNIVFAISNNFKGVLSINKMGTKGFSTKGKKRGYGLNLVKYLIDHDHNLENIREINGNVFTQIIKIRI